MKPIFNAYGILENTDEIKKLLAQKLDTVGKKLNLDSPRTIQDKIMWLIFNESITKKTLCADKYKVRQYCNEKLGKDICSPLIAVYEKVDDIKWDELPNKFVIKCNHGFNMNILVKDKSKLNIKSTSTKLQIWLNQDFAMTACELQYYGIPRRIIVEDYLEDDTQKDSLFDYKFWCFNGNHKLYTINSGHGHGDILYYDIENDAVLDLYGVGIKQFTKPKHFDIMVKYASILASDFKFVRVDFYEVNGVVYLGEMTFTPGACRFKYKNDDDNVKIGNLLKL